LFAKKLTGHLHDRWLRISAMAVSFSLAWAFVIICLCVMAFGYFGYVLPTTLHAKAYGNGWLSMGALLHTLKLLVFGYGTILLFIAIAWLLTRVRFRDVLCGIPMGLHFWSAMLLCGYVVISTNVQSRYALMIWPWLVCLLAHLLSWIPVVSHRLTLLLLCVLAVAGQSMITVLPALANRVHNAQQQWQYSEAIRAATSPDDLLGLYAIGEIAYTTRRRVFDFGGIVTPEIMKIPEKDRFAYGVSNGVDYVTMLEDDLPKQKVPLESIMCSARFLPGTWVFPPSRYRKQERNCLVPVGAFPEYSRIRHTRPAREKGNTP
jgi:hypothetical protein